MADGHGAVFAAPGAQAGMKLAIPGEALPGVTDGLRFLKSTNLGRSPKVQGRVLVIGGGNVAMDAARSALRLGASEVVVLYRRTRDEMPAAIEEIHEAEEEGIAIRFLVGPVKVEGTGRATGLACVRMELGPFDDSGRRRPVVIADSQYVEPADLIIAAIGQSHDPSWLGEDAGVVVTKRDRIQVDPFTLATPLPGLYAGGDAVTGPWTVTDAMAQGERAAISIDMFLRGMDPALGRLRDPEPVFDVPVVRLDDMKEQPRCPVAHMDAAERAKSFAEVVQPLAVPLAREEGNRCLRCDLVK
jgi:NADH-quinone oxidoreductase subunit F